MLPIRHNCVPVFLPYEVGNVGGIFSYLSKIFYEFVLNYVIHKGNTFIIIM